MLAIMRVAPQQFRLQAMSANYELLLKMLVQVSPKVSAREFLRGSLAVLRQKMAQVADLGLQSCKNTHALSVAGLGSRQAPVAAQSS
jgi:hypothetical protein